MPSHILHCSSSRSLDRHNKLQWNKTKVQPNAGDKFKRQIQEANSLYMDFCTVEHRRKNISIPALLPPNNHAATKFPVK